jgi:hypothetical protein
MLNNATAESDRCVPMPGICVLRDSEGASPQPHTVQPPRLQLSTTTPDNIFIDANHPSDMSGTIQHGFSQPSGLNGSSISQTTRVSDDFPNIILSQSTDDEANTFPSSADYTYSYHADTHPLDDSQFTQSYQPDSPIDTDNTYMGFQL